MQLALMRTRLGRTATMGRLYINGRFQCYTLEELARADVHSATVPMGEYKVVLEHNDQFDRWLPHLLGVPNFGTVCIHGDPDPQGHIVVGNDRNMEEEKILYTRTALASLMNLLIPEHNRIYIRVENCFNLPIGLVDGRPVEAHPSI